MPDLYPYQQTAVEFARSTGGRCIFGDDCGLGKTVEALAYITSLPSPDVLIVCPASVLYKWQRDAKTWAGREAELIVNSTAPLGTTRFDICSYAIMTRRWQELVGRYTTIVLDEFQAIKNFKAQRTRAAKKLTAYAHHILMLSGNPFLNWPIELFNALHILDPKAWPSVREYGNRYCGGLSERGLWQGATNLDELRERLKPYMIRRLKSEVLSELPPLTRTQIPVDIPNRTEYNQVRAQVREAIAALDPNHKGYFVNALDKLNMLRKVVGAGKAEIAVQWVEEMMEQLGADAKIVLYAHHYEVVKYLADALIKYGVVTYTGKDDAKTRDYKVGMFRSPGGPRIMVITSAGGEGIDLYGERGVDVSRIVLVEREWTPSAEAQVEARLHRIGQTNAVDAYYLVARKTIDEKLAALVEQKRKTLSAVFGESAVRMVIADLIREM